MKRILVVYNPRSSRYASVREEVLDQLKTLKGYLVGKYEVKPTSLEKNIASLAKILKDGDLVISAGGDATGIIASNSILHSDKSATLAALPYGNFNDLARTLDIKNIDTIFSKNIKKDKLYPLEIFIDNQFFRYATCYVTIGMTAEAVAIYDQPKMRKRLKSKFGRAIISYTSLANWYFKNRHKKQFIPDFKLNGVPQPKKTSDYAALNSRYMARVMKGGEDWRDPKTLRSKTDRLTNFWRLIKLMTKSILTRTPGSETEGDVLEFLTPATVTLQTEGESQTFRNIHKIEIKKGKKCLKVISH